MHPKVHHIQHPTKIGKNLVQRINWSKYLLTLGKVGSSFSQPFCVLTIRSAWQDIKSSSLILVLKLAWFPFLFSELLFFSIINFWNMISMCMGNKVWIKCLELYMLGSNLKQVGISRYFKPTCHYETDMICFKKICDLKIKNKNRKYLEDVLGV